MFVLILRVCNDVDLSSYEFLLNSNGLTSCGLAILVALWKALSASTTMPVLFLT